MTRVYLLFLTHILTVTVNIYSFGNTPKPIKTCHEKIKLIRVCVLVSRIVKSGGLHPARCSQYGAMSTVCLSLISRWCTLWCVFCFANLASHTWENL